MQARRYAPFAAVVLAQLVVVALAPSKPPQQAGDSFAAGSYAPGQAGAACVPNRRFRASTSGPMRLPNEPLTMIASPGPTAAKSLG